MFTDKVLFCEITSWLGSIGAEHYYGKIIKKGEMREEIDLTYKLSKKQAIYLNKKNSAYTYLSKNKQGDECTQFEDKEGIYKKAMEYMENNNLFDKYNCLIEGDGSSCPAYIIYHKDPSVKRILNTLYDIYEKENGSHNSIDQWSNKADEFKVTDF